ncbi:MAG: hypothetical protein KG003_07530 [Bacteroidetes bacterium]|nr:hypothetical protein [Bacteroidota bacterium]
MFTVRALNENDYDKYLVEWWSKWPGWEAPPKDFLPENGRGGLMVEKEGIPIVAGFVYLTNSAIAWNEFIISNFDYKIKTDREDAILILISELCRVAKSCGKKYVYTVVKNKSLIEHYKKSGFISGSKTVDEMFIFL